MRKISVVSKNSSKILSKKLIKRSKAVEKDKNGFVISQVNYYPRSSYKGYRRVLSFKMIILESIYIYISLKLRGWGIYSVIYHLK